MFIFTTNIVLNVGVCRHYEVVPTIIITFRHDFTLSPTMHISTLVVKIAIFRRRLVCSCVSYKTLVWGKLGKHKCSSNI